MSKVLNLFAKFEYYKSIDEMPIYNWLKIQETNDITWCLHEKRDCSKKELLTLERVIHIMTNEYMDTFGISEQFQRILRLKGELGCLEVEFLLSQDRVHLTFIEIKKKELEMALREGKKSDFKSVKVHAEKYMGRQINLREISTKDFYSILEEMKKESQNSKA